MRRSLGLVLALTLLAGVGSGCDAVIKRHSEERSAPTARATPRATPSPLRDTQAPTSVMNDPVPATPPPSVPTPARQKLEQKAKQYAAVPSLVLGADVSWPQCPPGMGIPQKRSEGLPMPSLEARFVVIGLTNGPGFHANPCLADQVAFARTQQLDTAAYSVISWPTTDDLATYGARGPYRAADLQGQLGNVGFSQARFNVAQMRAAKLPSPLVWLDVETVPGFPWSSDPTANAAVLRGAVRGYRTAGYRVGVYSTQAGWRTIVGRLRLGVPEWRAAGQTSPQEAQRRCGPSWSIQGGDAVISQWVQDRRDHDLTCPGTSTRLATWFHAS